MQISSLNPYSLTFPRALSALSKLYAYQAAEVRQRGVVPHMTATLLAILAKLISGASVRWVDCQPDTCQRVYFANHTSHLDALVVWAALPHEIRSLTRPVAAKDYWDKGLRKYLATRVFNALLIDRKEIKVHQSPVDLMIREIGDKKSLIVFPEGSRSEDGSIGEFKSGLYYLGKKRPDLELVPVHIDNLNRVLPRGEFLPVPLLSCISFGPPMWLEAGEPKNDFLHRAREAVRRLKEV
jgi:1-acyl-sn-glycerol-3-phosphate acyltransferase